MKQGAFNTAPKSATFNSKGKESGKGSGKGSKDQEVKYASWLTDKLLSGKLSTAMEAPNTIAFRDMLSWLVQEPAIAGTVENTKDTTFRPHSKEGQGWLFYGTVLLVPLMIFIFGLLFISRRQSKGAA